MAIRDIAGQRFGKLIALEVSGRSSTGKTTWLCVCDCGKNSVAEMANLVNGNTKSCGCLRRVSRLRHDLSGMRFSRLLAVKPIDSLRWECACDCGNTTVVRTVHLTHGHTRSCGCLQKEVSLTPNSIRKRERNSIAKWAKDVISDAARECDACGSTDKLHAHHILPFAEFGFVRIEPDNGACLCAQCHIEVHRMIRNGMHYGAALESQIRKFAPESVIKQFEALMRAGKKHGDVWEDMSKAAVYAGWAAGAGK